MLRTRDWKYVHRYPNGPNELYHLAVDPQERNNLVDCTEWMGTQESMRIRLDWWFTTYVKAELDGAGLFACQGRGQLDLVTNGPTGKMVFQPRR
jgi:hypothetical protein